jgi:phenylalanyl-tRNA synthetase beta chain
MPVINFNYQDLMSLVGRDLPAIDVLGMIPMMGADLHEYDAASGETSIEFFPNRPDLYSVEGLARALRAFLDISPGLKEYPVSVSGIAMRIDPSVASVRPFAVASIVRDLEFNDQGIRSLMELQEKLHITVGRKRSKVAIGVHDLDRVKPPFVYKAVPPESITFVPLAKQDSMDMREILRSHEKGRDYAHLLEGKDLYPIILDANGDVLSFPPIINGALTAVTEKTRNIFIDVTGTEAVAVRGALNIITTSLAERGGRIQSVVLRTENDVVSPNLSPSRWTLEPERVNAALGLRASPEEICACLRRMGHGAEAGKRIEVLVPAVRMDLLHTADLVEDVAIGHGYGNFGRAVPTAMTVGSELPEMRLADQVRQMMIGYSYFEVQTLTLSSLREQFNGLRRPRGDAVEVLNPVSEDTDCLRVSLLPSLLAVLRKGKHRELPQRIFEVGDVVIEGRRRKHLACVGIHPRASFTECKSLAEGIMRELGARSSIRPSASATYLAGRGADVVWEDMAVGEFGELHPEIIASYELMAPVIAFEVRLDLFAKGRKGIV